MVRLIFKYLLFLLGIFTAFSGMAQRHLFTEVEANTSRVYVGEPVQITIRVYTSTWFTSGVELQNIKVKDAFAVMNTSLSISKPIKGQTYAGVEISYYVFPYTDNDIEFPSLTFSVETPDLGGYEGVARKVKTRAVKVKVRPVPGGFEQSQWLVTPSLTVRDTWDASLKNVKVGDVLERKIYRKAQYTVYDLIPPIEWDSIPNVSNYPSRTATNNENTKESFYAERTDAMRYLFEKEGEVVLPEITLVWWNASHKKIYKKTLKELRIMVAPNPDLGMLESIKDSLAMVNAQTHGTEVAEEEPFSFLGMTWQELLVVTIGFVFVIKSLMHVIPVLVGKVKKRWVAFYQSEKYFFWRFLLSIFTNEKEKQRAFYRWVDCLNLKEYTLSYFKKSFGERSEAKISSNWWYWKKARKSYFLSQKVSISRKNGWINP